MKRTLLITLDYPPMVGGVSFYYKNLTASLPPDSFGVLHNNQDALLWPNKWLWPRWLKGLWTSYQQIKSKKIECLIAGQVLPIGIIALIWHLVWRIPYIVMTHAMDVTLPFGQNGSRRKQWLTRKIYRHARYVTTISIFTQQQLIQQGVPAKKIILLTPCPTVTPLDLPLSTAASEETDSLKNKRILLSVGRLVERKGVDQVIRVLPALIKKYSNLVYVIIGEGNYRPKLEKLATQCGVEQNICFLGTVEKTELAKWYQRCEIFIMPSRVLANSDVEGFGIVFLEAGSFGKPVIAGLSGGVGDAVIDGETGLLVDPQDHVMLQKAITRLLTDVPFARQLGTQARKRVERDFQWPQQAAKLVELLS